MNGNPEITPLPGYIQTRANKKRWGVLGLGDHVPMGSWAAGRALTVADALYENH